MAISASSPIHTFNILNKQELNLKSNFFQNYNFGHFNISKYKYVFSSNSQAKKKSKSNFVPVKSGQITSESLSEVPEDYEKVLKMTQKASLQALKDGKNLQEIEFPTSGLDSVPGDGEGGIEMNESMKHLQSFCDFFDRKDINYESKLRIFFPDSNEVSVAKKDIFVNSSFQIDFLTKISGLEDFGFGKKLKIYENVQKDENILVIAYPYFNVNEIIAVEELYSYFSQKDKKSIIVFNGELDRIRTGYYPSFFYPKLGDLSKHFLPKFESIFYLHNFKGNNGGKLFRVYPEPWQVLKLKNGKWQTVHTQETMPTLKQVALEILPKF